MNRHPTVLTESVFKCEDRIAQQLNIIGSDIYHTNTYFGKQVWPPSGSLKIRTKKSVTQDEASF